MSTRHPSLNRPYADFGDFVDFVNLQGGYEAFDLSESVGVKPSGEEDVWYGREIAGREWETLYRTSETRWVLVFVIPPGHEADEGPQLLDRELTPMQAARWLRLNKLALPAGLKPAGVNDDDERRVGQARLDRDWKPPGWPHEASTAQREMLQDGTVLPPPKESAPETEPTSLPPSPAVILKGPERNPIVRGKEKKRLTKARYDVVKALLDANRNLLKDELDRKSGHSDARKFLKRLAQSDPDWEAVIEFPSVHGSGYGIRR